MPLVQTPDAQTFPHEPQFIGSNCMSTHSPAQHVWLPVRPLWQHVIPEPERQTWAARQQNGFSPGPTTRPGLFSAISPGGQQRAGCLL